MTQARPSGWKLLLILIVATLPAAANPWLYPHDPKNPAAWAGIIAVIGHALIGWLTRGLFFGLLVATLIGAYPLFFQNIGTSETLHLAQALGVASCVLMLVAWHLLHAPRFVWWAWILLGVGLSFTAGYAWRLEHFLGIAYAASSGLLLLAGSLLVTRPPGVQRVRGNEVMGFLLAVLVPVGALAIAWGTRQPDWSSLQTLLPTISEPLWPPILTLWSARLTDSFFVVPWWVTAPILLYAWWRTVWRGRQQLAKGQTPASWVVSWYILLAAAATLFLPSASLSLQMLLPWFFFLVLFLVFDLLQGVGEKLVLTPPEGKQI